MSLQHLLVELAEGVALGFAEELVEHLKADAAGRNAEPHARAVGQQLATGLLDHVNQPADSDHSTGIRRVRGQLLPPPNVAETHQMIAQHDATWNHKHTPTPELLRAMADYQERVSRGQLD